MIDEDLLIHSATAEKLSGYDADRNPKVSDTYTLSKIRIVTTEAERNSTNGMEKSDSMTLYFDCSISSPSGFIPEEGMKVIWNEKVYTIRSVKPSYALSNSPEFYRCELV